MRIDRLEIENFKKYARQTFDLHPQFTLFAGENGSGKTTVLDALAVAAGIWLVEPPDSTLADSGRNISPLEIRLEMETDGDRRLFRERKPVKVKATGRIGDLEPISWTRQISSSGRRTTNAGARDALNCIRDLFARDASGEHVLCPVLAYYGAGRAWLPSNKRIPKTKSGPVRRWTAFYDCFSERIRFGALQDWFKIEAIERGNRGGHWRPGFESVQNAILRCLPGADEACFNADRDQIVFSIDGQSQPFENLSAGQRMLMAMVADLAIKAVTQNAFLIEAEVGQRSEMLPEVLRQTPGLVLIDELDVHLHPKWQRRIAKELKETFPSIQFVCTSHSPQVIGELPPEEIRYLDGDAVTTPARSFGIDSSRILEEVMDSKPRNEDVERLLARLSDLIDKDDLNAARGLLPEVEATLGPDDPEVTRARAMINFLEPVE
jgi:predicted ATP-binding protein involved in virulence